MPLFKRRNAVKVKNTKNVPQESPANEDETSVISEINSVLNELVNTVSEQTDAALRNDEHSNQFPKNGVSNQTDYAQGNSEISSPVLANNISHEKDSSQVHDKCSSSTSRNSISEQKCISTQENDACGPISFQAENVVKERDSTQKSDKCTDAGKTNNVSKNTKSSQENNAFPVIMEGIAKRVDSTQKNDGNKNPATVNDISNQICSTQKSNEDTLPLLTNSVSKEIDSALKNSEQSDAASNISDPIKQELDDSNSTKSESSETDPEENAIIKRFKSKKKTRSSSESGSTIESQSKYIRRKFGSEAEIMSICKKILPPEQQQGINEAVVKYIDNVIKESVLKAVKSINVDNLCEELIKGVSSRTNSESNESEADFVVEQRLSSNSISELVELQNVGNKMEEEGHSLPPECDGTVSETESIENETDDVDCASFRGYLADLEDTDDLKSAEEDSLYNSSCSGLGSKLKSVSCNSEGSGNTSESGPIEKTSNNENNETMTISEQTVLDKLKVQENCREIMHEEEQQIDAAPECVDENEKFHRCDENRSQTITEEIPADQQEQRDLLPESTCRNSETRTNLNNEPENLREADENVSSLENINEINLKIISTENSEISLKSLDEETSLLMKNDFKTEENKNNSQIKGGSLPNQNTSEEEKMKINWKVGNLQVKLPHKSRGKTSLKAWKKRRVVIQPDEFVNDPTNQSLVISVYGSKKHETTFWHSVSSKKAVVFRSSSHTHRYAFTISEDGQAIIHLSAENESETQEWMAAIRAVLWPPSPFMELEKMLSGQEFEVSIIDNEFSYHAGLLGMYGYLSITPKKLILLHPQQGYVIQEWYLNTVDKFQFVLQQKTDDMHKVLCMTTCKDSSTGQGEIIFFCKEAVTLLQALATTIHQVLSYHSKQEGGKYQRELEELAEWMVAPPQDCLNVENDEHYKVPPRQVKSLLDIPNFIFNKSLSPVASAIYPAPNTEVMETLDATKNKLTNTSQDSGISTCTSGDDFLNCSTTSFILGGGSMTGKSSDSELSDTYTPPRTPEIIKKKMLPEAVKEESSVIEE